MNSKSIRKLFCLVSILLLISTVTFAAAVVDYELEIGYWIMNFSEDKVRAWVATILLY